MRNYREPTALQKLKTLHELDEGPASNWYWILRSRYRNVFRNEVHADLKVRDFTKATTREEIVRFYEELYEQLLDYASRQEKLFEDGQVRIRNNESRIANLEQDLKEAQSAWRRYKDRFNAVMDLLTQNRMEQHDEMMYP